MHFFQFGQKDRKTEGQIDRKIERQKDGQTERQKDRKTDRQKDRKAEGRIDRKIERQKDRQTERQKDRKTERLKSYFHLNSSYLLRAHAIPKIEADRKTNRKIVKAQNKQSLGTKKSNKVIRIVKIQNIYGELWEEKAKETV